jgi:DNA repair exonuclease SbcCD nuclease subunit
MAKESFRFIHASDFHLERPFQDIFDLPDHLKRALVDAPWKAAATVFEHALSEHVDFVLLAGDIVNPATTGAQGVAFLLEHFEALKGKRIEVFWVGGSVDDPDRWPSSIALPSNVHLFSKKQAEQLIFRRNQSALVTVIGRSTDGNEIVRAAEFAHEPDDTYVIALAYGNADAESLSTENIDYWALGGKHQSVIVQTEEPAIRYCGSPQSRCLKEEGPHGFVMVDVDAQRHTQIHTIDCDLFRYSEQDIDAEDIGLGKDIRGAMAKRIARLQSEAAGRSLLIKWRISMDLENASVVGPAALEELLSWLRREFGHGQPCVWSTDIEILPPKELPASWKDEDTILGDFLRIAAAHKKEHAKNLSLKAIIQAEVPATNLWQTTLTPSDTTALLTTLERSTLLGVDLLRGHQIDLLAPSRRFGGAAQ